MSSRDLRLIFELRLRIVTSNRVICLRRISIFGVVTCVELINYMYEPTMELIGSYLQVIRLLSLYRNLPRRSMLIRGLVYRHSPRQGQRIGVPPNRVDHRTNVRLEGAISGRNTIFILSMYTFATVGSPHAILLSTYTIPSMRIARPSTLPRSVNDLLSEHSNTSYFGVIALMVLI